MVIRLVFKVQKTRWHVKSVPRRGISKEKELRGEKTLLLIRLTRKGES